MAVLRFGLKCSRTPCTLVHTTFKPNRRRALGRDLLFLRWVFKNLRLYRSYRYTGKV
jgi:hypothetical protein